ncbi:hypothetical protein Mapa_012594 [Marchantia paleacea]|nr:hypothetical protein Mapa_012594 [Marchantia paleacea]
MLKTFSVEVVHTLWIPGPFVALPVSHKREAVRSRATHECQPSSDDNGLSWITFLSVQIRSACRQRSFKRITCPATSIKHLCTTTLINRYLLMLCTMKSARICRIRQVLQSGQRYSRIYETGKNALGEALKPFQN